EILIGRAVGPSPAPYIAEHAAMKAASETFVDGIHPARERPGVRLEDVLLFQFIQLAAQRYMGRDRTFALLVRKWRRVIWLIKRSAHCSSQSRAGRRKSFSTS